MHGKKEERDHFTCKNFLLEIQCVGPFYPRQVKGLCTPLFHLLKVSNKWDLSLLLSVYRHLKLKQWLSIILNIICADAETPKAAFCKDKL